MFPGPVLQSEQRLSRMGVPQGKQVLALQDRARQIGEAISGKGALVPVLIGGCQGKLPDGDGRGTAFQTEERDKRKQGLFHGLTAAFWAGT